MTPLLQSRRFWLGILDIVISAVLLVVGIQYPAALDLVKSLIGYLQPLIIVLIIALTVDDTLHAWFTYQYQLRQLDKAK